MAKRKFKILNAKPLAIFLIIPLLILLSLPKILNLLYISFDSKNHLEKLKQGANYSNYWKENVEAIEKSIGEPERTFAYYKVREWENIDTVAQKFGLARDTLAELNRSEVVAGLTIKIPPPTKPLDPLPLIDLKNNPIEIVESDKAIQIGTSARSLQTLDLLQIKDLIKDKAAIEEVKPKHFLLNKTLIVKNKVRLQLLSDKIDTLDLKSNKDFFVALTSEGGQILIKGLQIRSWDTQLNTPDTEISDRRAFIRARRSSRMDIIDSDISYLGYNALDFGEPQGGTYGVSWRIPDDKYGIEIVTGWVENSKFHNNYFGAYTFGASGMVFRGNEFFDNIAYGLDPHDDSNNMLIENNKFHHNGKHGFIMSKRCKNNIIKNNLSYGNKGHGLMLHEDSRNNLIEQNTAYKNTDNIAIFNSSNHIIRNNVLYDPRHSNIRLSSNSHNNLILNNDIENSKGIFIYENSNKNLIRANKIKGDKFAIHIDGLSDQNIVVENKFISDAPIEFIDSNSVILGPNYFE